MKNNVLGTKIVTQIGFVVNDIEASSQKYSDFFGADKPPIIITDSFEKANTQYNGSPSKARAKLAFFDVGDSLQIELIEPDHEPSTWREYLDSHGEGVHHIAFNVNGMDEKILKLGKINMPLLQKGDYEGGRYSYIDSTKDLKVIIELLENF